MESIKIKKKARTIPFGFKQSQDPDYLEPIKEVEEYLAKKIEKDELIEKISIKTRQYAKRQATWARGNMSDWNKIKPNSLNKFLKKNLYIS